MLYLNVLFTVWFLAWLFKTREPKSDVKELEEKMEEKEEGSLL